MVLLLRNTMEFSNLPFRDFELIYLIYGCRSPQSEWKVRCFRDVTWAVSNCTDLFTDLALKLIYHFRGIINEDICVHDIFGKPVVFGP